MSDILKFVYIVILFVYQFLVVANDESTLVIIF